jgi:gas vesicle protein
METRKFHPGNFLKGILLGSILAAGIALLTAPRSGVETRQMLREKSEQLQEDVAQSIEKVREQVETVISDTRQQAEQLVGRIGEQGAVQSNQE